MIQIITEVVTMPPIADRRFKKECKNNRWSVIDTQDNSLRYKGSFENVVLAWHNLNKKFYKENPITTS